jgi:uncharacterized membrane protein
VPELSSVSRYRIFRSVARALTAAFFIAAGANHFLHAGFYIRIVPPSFPSPALLVTISGVCEIAGGVGILIPPLRQAAGWGLIALLIAVFPANLYMAQHPEHFTELHAAAWLLWLRLPLQALFIAWVWYTALQWT